MRLQGLLWSCLIALAPRAQLPKRRQTLMFSATWPEEVQSLAHDFLKERGATSKAGIACFCSCYVVGFTTSALAHHSRSVDSYECLSTYTSACFAVQDPVHIQVGDPTSLQARIGRDLPFCHFEASARVCCRLRSGQRGHQPADHDHRPAAERRYVATGGQ